MPETYDKGDAVLIRIEVRKWVSKTRWDLCIPDSIKIIIRKGPTIIINGANMRQDNNYAGFYYYVWQTALDSEVGDYSVEITTTVGDFTEITKDTITLQ